MDQTINKSKMFAAIDVGTTKIVALVGYKDENGNIVVLGKGEEKSAGIMVGQVSNVHHASESVKKAVDAARAEAGFFPDSATIGIAGRHIRSMTFRVQKNRENPESAITEEELEKITEEAKNAPINSDEKIIHKIPLNYVLDQKETTTNPLKMTCNHIDANFHVVYGKINDLKMLNQCIENAGLKINELYLEPLASADAVLSEKQKKLGVALIDIGGGTSDIAIFHDNALCTTEVVPLAGNLITSDISKAYGILETDAEAIKKEYGEAIKDNVKDNMLLVLESNGSTTQKEINLRDLAGIIQARVEDIIDSAMFTIQTSGYANKLDAGIVVTGGGANLKNLSQLLSFKIGMGSSIKTPLQCISYNDNTFFNDSRYSTVVGLLMKAALNHIEKIEDEKKIEVTTETKDADKTTKKDENKRKESKGNWLQEKLKHLKETILTVEDY